MPAASVVAAAPGPRTSSPQRDPGQCLRCPVAGRSCSVTSARPARPGTRTDAGLPRDHCTRDPAHAREIAEVAYNADRRSTVNPAFPRSAWQRRRNGPNRQCSGRRTLGGHRLQQERLFERYSGLSYGSGQVETFKRRSRHVATPRVKCTVRSTVERPSTPPLRTHRCCRKSFAYVDFGKFAKGKCAVLVVIL